MAVLNLEEIKTRRQTFGLFLRPKKLGDESQTMKIKMPKKTREREAKDQRIKLRGKIFTRDLWSDNYYMQIMKLANLQQMDNFFTRAKRQKIYQRKMQGRAGIHYEDSVSKERLPRIEVMREYFRGEEDQTTKSKSNSLERSMRIKDSLQNRSLRSFIGDCDGFIQDSQELRK